MSTFLRRIVCFLLILTCNFQLNSAEDNDSNNAYEVWASDQSNSIPNTGAPGVSGSYLWIWGSKDIKKQFATGIDAKPIACGKNRRRTQGPCDLWAVFPGHLQEMNADGKPTGNRLSDLNGFGRLHGMLPDPQNRYVTANIFAPSGGYVGIIDTNTKEAIALFRVTGTNVGGGVDQRTVHMSFWDAKGSSVIVGNLAGKILERIDVTRSHSGKIKTIVFNRSASLGVGKSMIVTAGATYFAGRNQHGKKLIGGIVGDYKDADLGDLTPNGVCKENGCTSGKDATSGGRPNNVIICPIPSTAGNVYITMGGGGLLIAKTDATPMSIVGEYGNEVVNGAGCGGGQAGRKMWLNAGVSASSAGATQSTSTMYAFDDNEYEQVNLENQPLPTEVFKDATNTNTLGNLAGASESNPTGQIPGTTTRRDAHGTGVTKDQRYVHNFDRIRNNVEVFNAYTYERTSYDLTSADGQGQGIGACFAKSVNDDPELPTNDPAPDLLEATPDGKYLMVGLRGPRPVYVGHSAQGSCPGVGIVELLQGGASGKLVGVLRTTNTLDNSFAGAPGGHSYTGLEHSDVHAATVVKKFKNRRG